MDLNPRITTPNPHGWPYELATWCIESKSKVLVLLCAWLHSSHSEHRTQEEKEESKKSDWDLHTAKYWCERLRPLWDDECSVGNDDVEDMERTVIICNRNGLERGTFSNAHHECISNLRNHLGYLFAGTSIILKMSRKKGSPEVIGIMKKDEQALRTFNF
jgi:protein N-terminal amidase